jgi:ABC-type branched-subunit amino acid transport system substrate-binding protein
MKAKSSVFAATTIAAAMVFSALPAQAAGVDLKIGTIHPLTGGNADYGIGLTTAAEFGAESITKAMKAAKVAGSCKVVASEDDQATPALAVEAATKLVKSNKVHAIIGPLTSGSTVSAAQSVTVPNNVLMIATAASSPTITKFVDKDLLFRTYPSDAFQGKVIVAALQKAFGKEFTLSIGARNDAFGTALANVVTNEWVKGGGDIGRKVLWNPENATFDSEAKLLTDGNPDAWVIIDFPDTFAKVGPALVRTGKWDAKKTFFTEAMYDAAVIKTIGVDIMAGARGTAAKSIGVFSDKWKKDRKAAKPSTKETFVDASAFDATVLTCLAAIHAKSTKAAALSKSLRSVSGSKGGKNIPWTKLGDAVKAAAAGQNFTYQGAWTTAKFDAYGDSSGALFRVFSVGADGSLSSKDSEDVRF